MCGVAGWYRFRPEYEPPDLQQMLASLRHRGPDAQGEHVEPTVGLGHVRLSILDLAGGGQPMSNDSGDVWLTFNGEIFNYLELRETLEAAGHRFRTRSDTEVLLRCYEAYGEDCVHHFNGQWAFAIWDRRQGKLFLSRDPVGVRPLFYWQGVNLFIFASEIKALFACRDVPRAMDVQGLVQLLTFWTNVAPRTLFQNIHELPPGCSLIISAQGIHTKAYWDWSFHPESETVGRESREQELLETLRQAVARRLRSDVPVAAFLSGGLDSTFTAALAKQESQGDLRSFSLGFTDPVYDESSYQRQAADFLGTNHETFPCEEDAIARVFPRVVWHAEKPMLRTSPAPMYLLARRVREAGLKVVLTGEGADEVFGGYDLFKENKIRRFWARQPNSRWRPRLLRRLYPYLAGIQAQPESFLTSFFRIEGKDLSSPFFSHEPRWETTSHLRRLLTPAWASEIADYDPRDEMRSGLPSAFRRLTDLGQAQYLEAKVLLPGYILSTQGDRMTMAHGVEGRHPFLDRAVIAFANRLSPGLKMQGLKEKWILKEASRGIVPESVRNRAKQPYRAPDTAVFFGKKRWDYVEDLLDSRRIANDGIFSVSAVNVLTAKARQGRIHSIRDQMALVAVLSTQIWHDTYLASFPREPLEGCVA